MSYLYVIEQGSVVCFREQRFEVRLKNTILTSIPCELLEVVEVFGNVQITTQCMRECMIRNINVIFFSLNGAYYGRLISTNHVNVGRQKLQAKRCEDDAFKLAFSKRIIDAKIRNQMAVLRRYARSREIDITKDLRDIKTLFYNVERSDSIEKLMGYEGYAAKLYFKNLGKMIHPSLAFANRNRRPPKDPFNSMISLGYSLIMNEIYGALEAKGLNPFFGLMHSDREKHPTLCSDLMEEWRAVLIDSTTMQLSNRREITLDNFYKEGESQGVYLTNDGFKIYVRKLEEKFKTKMDYLSYIDYPVSFRKAIDLQVNQLVTALETGNVLEYHPIIIR